MDRTQPRSQRGRKLVGFTLAGVLTVTGLALGAGPVVAHDGVDHGAEPGGDAALDWDNYEKTTLTKDVGEPIDLAVLPDGRVLHTARNGDVRLTDPATGVTRITNTIPVYANSEDGLQSIGIDPDFEENNWVYLVYAPPGNTPAGSAPNTLPAGQDESYWDQWVGVNRLSRFQWTGEGLDLASEQQILDVEVQRGQCCHVGADFDWDADGNLYLGTGDNTPAGTPGANGFAPNNDAPGMNPGFDSRRGAGNTNDLRGKILRIHVEEDGSYTIPEGNLFPEGTEGTRPEIFVMGVRNPFKLDVDPETNSLSWGDYGPDATKAVAETAGRGPMGLVEWNVVGLDDPHNAGWPFVTGDNFAYNDWDFSTATPGAFFDPENLVNDSRWNTGLTNLPPARPATVYYGDNPGDQPWDELVNFGTGNGQGPMGGPVYHRPADAGPDAWPAYWEGKAFFGEFSQDYVAAFTVDWDTFEITHIEDVTPNAAITAEGWPPIDNPMDIEFGPDGSMYVLDYGDGFFRANPDAGLHRIAYAEGNKAPRAEFTATPTSSSTAPLTVQFDASASSDPEGGELRYDWDFDGDGTFDATGVEAEHTYTEIAAYTARLKVTDPEGKFTLTSHPISVGNQAPEVTLTYPENGGFFTWGDAVPFQVTTQDAEDGTATDCTRVSWTYGLGHDEHAHPEVSGTGCKGAFKTNPDSPEHGPGALLYGAVVVTYRDAGANGLPAASGEATLRLNPREQQAEHAARTGVTVYADETASAGNAVRGLGTGDSLTFTPVSFSGITGAVVRANGGGEVQLRWGAADAAPFATATIPAGAGWKDVEIAFDAPEGTGDLVVTSADELAVDAITMVGPGVADTAAPTVAHTLTPAAPTGAGGVFTEPVRFAVQAADDGALASVQYSRDGGATWMNLAANQQYGVTFSESGTYDLRYRATDTQGLVSEVGSVQFTIDLEAPEEPTVDTTTTATVAAGRVPFGAPGEVTVAVAAAEGVASGEVVLTVGETEVGRGSLGADGTAVVALDPALGVGTHTVTASFVGGEVFKPSSGTVRLTVARTTSTVAATVSPNPVKPAVAAKATVQVTTGSDVAAAGDVTVTVKRNNQTVATLTGTLDASGASVVSLGRLPEGTYKVDVAYGGTAGISGSTTSTTLTVRS